MRTSSFFRDELKQQMGQNKSDIIRTKMEECFNVMEIKQLFYHWSVCHRIMIMRLILKSREMGLPLIMLYPPCLCITACGLPFLLTCLNVHKTPYATFDIFFSLSTYMSSLHYQSNVGSNWTELNGTKLSWIEPKETEIKSKKTGHKVLRVTNMYW